MPEKRRERPSIALLVDEQRDALDSLSAELSGGVRGAAHFDQLEERATAIGRGLREAFRQGAIA